MTIVPAVAVLTPAQVKAQIAARAEFAFIDLREEGVHITGHPLYATSLPLSQLELRLANLIPRPSAPIVLSDDGEGLVERALVTLERFGYTNVSIMAGGTAGWRDAGFELFEGWNVPSKALAEAVEHRYATPRIEPLDLKAKIDAGEDLVILDSRPLDEFFKMSIPGAIDCAGAELVYRAHAYVQRPETLVVVNCAGRTRSIIGAQSLINSGLPNPVVALKNGTMGWQLAGLDLAHGRTDAVPPPGAEGLARAQAAARAVAARFNVNTIDRATLDRFHAESARRTLYVFDVRSPQEYAAGHLRGARSVPGGQLVQTVDRHAGVRNARIVLVDDDGVRATMTASWLIQLGAGEIFVLGERWADGSALESGPEPERILGLDAVAPETIAPAALHALLRAGGVTVVDIGTSLLYRRGHIPGAWFAIRSRFAATLPNVPRAALLVLTSTDGTLARLAAREAAAATGLPVRVLEGGTNGWIAAGFPVETGDGHAVDAFVDVLYKPHERIGDTTSVMREYLAWETGLNAQLVRDGDAPFLHLLNDHD